MTNFGMFGNPWAPDSSGMWRGADVLAEAALWVGALASDNLPYVTTGWPDLEFRPNSSPLA